MDSLKTKEVKYAKQIMAKQEIAKEKGVEGMKKLLVAHIIIISGGKKMKKSILTGFALGVLVCGGIGNAFADTINYTETYNPTPDVLMSETSNSSISWIFDITDNAGWSTQDQIFSNGTISVVVEDDGGDNAEKATFTFETSTDTPTNADILSNIWSSNFSVIFTTFIDGKVNATLTATRGDFYFREATLNVASTYTPETHNNPVPEPATMFLFGTCIVGLTGYMRKKKTV
jgi:hypothetical protein